MKRLRKLRFGEALLWIGFAVCIAYVVDRNEQAVTLSGIFALAAIGVRATRVDPVEQPVDPA